MRIKVNINEPNNTQNMATLQTWIESHADGVEDFFMAGTPHCEGLVFQFVYAEMLGCHRLFIYNPIDDALIDFFAEDFTDIGKWIFDECAKFFSCDYDIIG